jgi:hypothetical protein
MLCERHNSALSPLDAKMGRLFAATSPITVPATGEDHFWISGYDIERWGVKLLTGLVASKSVAPDARRADVIPALWLQLLFTESVLPPRAGLYMPVPESGTLRTGNHIRLQTLELEGEIHGALFDLRGHQMIVILANVEGPLAPATVFGRETPYRPQASVLVNEDGQRLIRYWWFDDAEGTDTSVRHEWTPDRH